MYRLRTPAGTTTTAQAPPLSVDRERLVRSERGKAESVSAAPQPATGR